MDSKDETKLTSIDITKRLLMHHYLTKVNDLFVPKTNRNQEVCGDQQRSFQPVDFVVIDHNTDGHYGQHIQNNLKMRKVECHGLIQNPTHNNCQGNNEETNLRAGSNGNYTEKKESTSESTTGK